MPALTPIPQVCPWLGQAEAAAAASAITSNWITEGPNCTQFSERLRTLIGVPFGVFAPNGTLALSLAMMAIGIGPGDEVLVPDITFIGSANAVILLGATPIFVDVEPETFQIDLTHAQSLVSGSTRAIMPVHLYGAACDMTSIVAFARHHNICVVEDAAQGIGVSHRERHVGGIGDVGCFSFFADKTITTGEGGFVVCKDEPTYDRLRYFRNQGRFTAGTFEHPAIGYNFRITDVQAAIGLVQLDKLDEIIRRKRAIHAWYEADLKDIDEVRLLGPAPHGTHVPFRCVLVATRARALMAHLEACQVQSRSFFYPMHKQPCFASYFADKDSSPSLRDADYPNSTYGYEHGLCLPVYPTLLREQVTYITTEIARFYRKAA
ncbi:DegT/DnrJ/EryC1/StrS family aminotransferase [Bradyrhizobium embrapense]|uniref:DegT/DnrJ/EryC1/StrS family aminotransferase n=1 Tax=Bradyrhizobium embrapense TaxID=630921 RepID=UPI000A0743F8|nr:DegT/DnrJ/EryC1/StrS family aminotransferase [Bradyrhizobium embrapense]